MKIVGKRKTRAGLVTSWKQLEEYSKANEGFVKPWKKTQSILRFKTLADKNRYEDEEAQARIILKRR